MTRNVVQHASPVLGNLILFKICTWKILEASVGTSSTADCKVSLFLDKFVILKHGGGLTEACADGKLMSIFGCRQSTAWVCGRSHAGIAGSNHAEGIAVCLLWMLCVIRQRFLRRVDLSSREFLPSVCVQWRTQEFCSGGVQQIQLRTEDRENGDLGAVAP
jgi:hypothetical protein